jgi:hypothetical protein
MVGTKSIAGFFDLDIGAMAVGEWLLNRHAERTSGLAFLLSGTPLGWAGSFHVPTV